MSEFLLLSKISKKNIKITLIINVVQTSILIKMTVYNPKILPLMIFLSDKNPFKLSQKKKISLKAQIQ
jgi:hypothetical protein